MPAKPSIKSTVRTSQLALDVQTLGVTAINQRLQNVAAGSNETHFALEHPEGEHVLAVGLMSPITVEIMGTAGYYCAGMNQQATRHHPRQRLHRRRREHDVGLCAGEGQCQPVGRRHRPWRPARHRRRRGGALRHLDEGRRHRRRRQRRPHVGIHGAGGLAGRLRQCRRCARRFALRGEAVRARQGEEPRRRLHREGDAAGASRAPRGLLERAEIKADAAKFRRYGSARKLYNFDVDNADAY